MDQGNQTGFRWLAHSTQYPGTNFVDTSGISHTFDVASYTGCDQHYTSHFSELPTFCAWSQLGQMLFSSRYVASGCCTIICNTHHIVLSVQRHLLLWTKRLRPKDLGVCFCDCLFFAATYITLYALRLDCPRSVYLLPSTVF